MWLLPGGRTRNWASVLGDDLERIATRFKSGFANTRTGSEIPPHSLRFFVARGLHPDRDRALQAERRPADLRELAARGRRPALPDPPGDGTEGHADAGAGLRPADARAAGRAHGARVGSDIGARKTAAPGPLDAALGRCVAVAAPDQGVVAWSTDDGRTWHFVPAPDRGPVGGSGHWVLCAGGRP